mmetsp:Transcript_22276/g.66431  ORF Transcript_22276/g.66431 Transcript_22276/m.66431 type:complete len:96 (+) Transcript_22276:264-551(+)
MRLPGKDAVEAAEAVTAGVAAAASKETPHNREIPGSLEEAELMEVSPGSAVLLPARRPSRRLVAAVPVPRAPAQTSCSISSAAAHVGAAAEAAPW